MHIIEPCQAIVQGATRGMKMEKAMFGLMMVFAAMLCAGIVTVAISGGVGAVAVSGFVVFLIGGFGVVAVGHA